MRRFSILVCCFFVSCIPLSQQLSPEEEQARKAQAETLVIRATKLMLRGDETSLQSATSALELARDLVGERADILDALGCVEWRRGSVEFAEYFFKLALKADPNFDPAYVHLAFIAEDRGETDVAEELLKKALKLNPMNTHGRNNLGALELRKGEIQNSRHNLLKALQNSNQQSLPVLFNLEQVSTKDLP